MDAGGPGEASGQQDSQDADDEHEFDEGKGLHGAAVTLSWLVMSSAVPNCLSGPALARSYSDGLAVPGYW